MIFFIDVVVVFNFKSNYTPMRAILLFVLTTILHSSSQAQSAPTMLSQSRYEVMSGGTFALKDSIIHTHGKNRISYALPLVEIPYIPNDGVYMADESIRVINPQPGLLVDRMTRKFISSGLIGEYLEETKQGTLYKQTFKETYSYNQDGLRDTQWSNNTLVITRTSYVYQNGTPLALLYHEEVPTYGWKLVGLDSFLANGTDSTYLRYYLNVSTMQLLERHQYLRDANFKVLVDSFYPANPMGRTVTFTDYDASGRKVRDSVFTGGVLTYSYKLEYVYDNNGKLVARSRHNWDQGTSSYTNILIDSFGYNPVNQLTSVKYFKLVNNKPEPLLSSVWRFYYYGFPVSINDVADDKSLRLYPVPATAYINLDMSFNKPEEFTVRIIDMQGRVLRAWDEPAQRSYNKKILLDGMPAGNYIMQLHSAGQDIARSFSVIN
jgi:hypothetical protein